VVLAIEQQRRERRRQRQRVERRQGHGERDRHRELRIQASGSAWEERDRHEHRDENQRRRDDGPQHFAHRVDGRLARRHLEFLDMPLDVLDHDDRVVDDDAGGEDDAEQRQRVDGVAHQLDEGERADERDRDREHGDERAAPRL
jgi:hypothetical protein